jgi:hypothetical protein
MGKCLIAYMSFFLFLNYNQLYSQSKVTSSNPFKDGEWFEFRIHYGFLNASYASLELKKQTLNDTVVFYAKGYGKTIGFARWFFKVEDHYESYFDFNNIIPYKFIRNIDEGGYKKNIEIDFDHKKQIAYVNDKKKKRKKEVSFNTNVQDLISCFYYLRKYYPIEGISLNESFNINMFFDNENYIFKLKYLGKETIESKFGKIECLKFRPIVQSGRIFNEQESVTLWISNDLNRIPVRVQADIIVGSIKADLENFKNLKHSFKIIN